MNFRCAFGKIDSRETREIRVSLTKDECASVKAIRKRDGTDQADLIAKAYSLRHAYRELPADDGWRHAAPPQQIYVS